jgi:hypothetical protein
VIKAMIALGSATLALAAPVALDGPASARPHVAPAAIPTAPASAAPVLAAATPTATSTGVSVSPTASIPTVYWITAPCATGGFGEMTVDRRQHAFLPLSVTLCSTYKSKFSFAVVAFRPDWSFALATPGNLRPYAQSGPASVVADLDLNPGFPLPTVGVCILSSSTVRVACVRVDTTDGGVTTATPVDVDDPLVNRPVVYNGDLMPVPPDPECGTCLGLWF